MAEKKETQNVSDNAQLIAAWNWEKNADINPLQTALGSHKKVWWRCEKGHEWQSPISNRAKGVGCLYCSGRYPILGETDLASQNPQLASQWHPVNNGELKPSQVTVSSGKIVWWLGPCGHEWSARVYSRSKSSGSGCPICAGLKVLPGFNDLATTNPELLFQWHPAKNSDIKIDEVSAGSEKKVWWLCPICGFEWLAQINSRTKGAGCPHCADEKQTSFPEQAIFYYFQQVCLAENRNIDYGKEIDIWLPELQVGIEYNGWWHDRKKDADERKVKFFSNINIRIITIKEGQQNNVSGDVIEYIYHPINKDSLEWAIAMAFQILCISPPRINISKDRQHIYEQYIHSKKVCSIEANFPNVSKEWHPTKNGVLTPSNFTAGSQKKVWWQCAEGHEWQAVIYNRIKGSGCPICSGKKALVGVSDLATTHPLVASKWHPIKNGKLQPTDVMAGSSKKVWWLCSEGHEWQSRISHRTAGSGCPYCSGRYPVKGKTDLQTVNPVLSDEWDYEKNNGLTPAEVMPNSHKKVWWKCSQGHEWQASIADRNRGRGCPQCAKGKHK